jgi:hypothetical protein
MLRSAFSALAASVAITVCLCGPLPAQEAPKSIKIGYVISLSG